MLADRSVRKRADQPVAMRSAEQTEQAVLVAVPLQRAERARAAEAAMETTVVTTTPSSGPNLAGAALPEAAEAWGAVVQGMTAVAQVAWAAAREAGAAQQEEHPWESHRVLRHTRHRISR